MSDLANQVLALDGTTPLPHPHYCLEHQELNEKIGWFCCKLCGRKYREYPAEPGGTGAPASIRAENPGNLDFDSLLRVLKTYRKIWERLPAEVKGPQKRAMDCWSPEDHDTITDDEERLEIARAEGSWR